MPQTTRKTSTSKAASKPRQKSGNAAIRDMILERATPGGGPVTIPTTDSRHQASVRQLVEKMRDGKDGKPYIVEASEDGARVTVSLPQQLS